MSTEKTSTQKTVVVECELQYFKPFINVLDYWLIEWELLGVEFMTAKLKVVRHESWEVYNKTDFETMVLELRDEIYKKDGLRR